MERGTTQVEREAYSTAVGALWERVGGALARLERIAASPAEWDERLADELPLLQYSLHAGSELAHGIHAPGAAAEAHEELVSALADARDATAAVAAALELDGPEGVDAHLPEWRGVLFRVRLARLRALERSPLALGGEGRREPVLRTRPPVSAVLASVLVVGGGLLFTAGAVLAAWPLWAAGLMLVGGGLVLHRP